jgi:cytochrome c biogenesis protein CcmG/thiol:disulfide interchange protein DsbE
MPSTKKRKAREHEAHMKQLRVWGIVGGLVVLALIVTVVVSAGGSDQPSGGGISESRPVAVTGAPLPPLPTSGTDTALGMPAPTIAGQSFDGTPVTIDPGSTGKPTAIWFVAHWCPHCQVEIPRVVTLNQQGRLPGNVDIYAVSTSVNSSGPNYPPSAWLSGVGWPYPALADSADGAASAAYGLGSFPYLVVTDASGNVVYRHSGELGEDGIVSTLQQAAGG